MSKNPTEFDEIQGTYNTVGSWRNLAGLKEKLAALKMLQQKYPDSDLLENYIETVEETITEVKIENKQ